MNGLHRLLSRGATAWQIEAYLDRLDGVRRVAEVQSLRAPELEALFRICEGRRVSRKHLVPPGVPERWPVRYFGVRSWPGFRRFERRFFRSAPDAWSEERLWGYGRQPRESFDESGYFVVDEPPDSPELTLDYCELARDVQPRWWRWRRGRRSHGMPGRFVFGAVRDYLRRVSRHVCVGQTSQGGKRLNRYFAMVREG